MNEKLLAVMASWVGQDPKDFTAELESNPEAVAEKFSALKVLTTDDFNNALTNRVKAMSKDDIELMPESITKQLYNNSKAAALEAKENELQEEFGTNYKRLVDYKTTNDLVRLLAKNKTNAEPDKFEKLYNETKSSKDAEIEKIKADGISGQKALVKQFALSGLMASIPKEEHGKLDYIQFQFDKDYDVEVTDGKHVPLNKATGKIEVDENQNILSVDQVMRKVAATIIPLTETVPNGGRGSQQQAPPNNGSSTQYKSLDEFIDKGLKEKGVIPSSIEGQKQIAEYQAENK